jgi:TldD protein
MASAPFRPFDELLDRDAALARLRDAVAGADDGELFLERRRAETLVFDDARLKTASFDASEGFGLRAVREETAGYAHSTDISEPALARAVATARLAVGTGGGTLAAPPPRTNRKLYGDEDPLEGATFALKVETLREIDAFARALDSRVVQVSASLSASHQEVAILRPEGDLVTDIRPMSRLNISVIVEENGRREAGGHGSGGRHGLLGLIDRATWEATTRRRCASPSSTSGRGRARGRHGRGAGPRLARHPPPRGRWPRLGGDFNRKGTSAFAGLMGQRVAAPGVTVLDDGTIPDRRGSITVDDEGTPSNRTVLIEDGILVGYMQDRQNARLMGVQPTGNGRRESFAHIPMPRMTNTYMLAGDADPAPCWPTSRTASTPWASAAARWTSPTESSSSPAPRPTGSGRPVEEPVKGATLIGDGATALKQIHAIGNDMSLDPGIGNCGKAGQWVPVGVGQPSL